MASREAMVISAVVENKDAYVILSESEELFGPYGDAVSWMKKYYIRHKAVPSKETFEENFPDIELPETNGPSQYYLETLKDEYLDSRMEQIMLKSASSDLPAATKLEKMQQALSKLGQFANTSKDLSLMDVDDALEHFSKTKEISDLNGGIAGIPFGIDAIDSAYTTGMGDGHFIVFMGYSGRGKSMFSAQVAVQAWLRGHKVMVYSLEMSAEEYRDRVYAMMSEGMFKISEMTRGYIDKDSFRTWATKKFNDASDFIVIANEGMTDVTPNVVQSKIDTHRPELVVLDYMQLMDDNAKTREMTPKMKNLSRELKLMAVRNSLPIIAITAVTDEDNDKRNSPPMTSQISWSRAIEYDANLIVAVHRYDDTNLVEVVSRKVRNGDTFAVYLEVDFDAGVWTEKYDIPER